MKISSYIIESLRSSGIDVAFGLPGVHVLAMWEAIEQANMPYVGFRHEGAAAHAADGYGRATHKPGVVILSTGPGALNALSPLAEARVSSSPVLAITSTIPSRYRGKGKGFLHETASLDEAFAAGAGGFFRAEDPSTFPKVLKEALDATTDDRPHPVVLEVPMDVFEQEIEAPPVTLERIPKAPDQDPLAEAAELLDLSARPVILAGGGVLRAGASASLTTLAEKTDAPVFTTFMGKGAISENHPLAIGSVIRQPESQELLRDADLLLAVGTRFSAMSTGTWKLEVPSQLIHIDADPEEIGRNYPTRLGIVGDAELALSSLAGQVGDKTSAKDGAKRAKDLRVTLDSKARKQGPKEMEFLSAIRGAVPEHIHLTHDMCVASYWSWPFLGVNVPGTFHSPYGFGSLGFSFPAALGVAAATNQPVVAFTGDGGFQYHLRELGTAAQYQLSVKTLVFNDASWGVLRSFSRARYGSEFGLDIAGPDFVELAKAYGVRSQIAQEPDALAKLLADEMERPGPAVIEVPGAWELPPPSEYYKR